MGQTVVLQIMLSNTPGNLADKAAMDNLTAPNRGYSIWSLLVIMTLLAVLLVIPKPTSANLGGAIHALFVGCHQVALWLLAGTLAWMILGKRRSVLVIECLVLVLVWGPLFAIIAEELISGSSQGVVRGTLKAVGLFDGYGAMYDWIFRTFGYGPI